MSVATIKLLDVQTGESRLYYDDSWSNSGRYHYEDGNGSCDCNRGLYFEYAHGVSPQDAETYECGHEAMKVESVFYQGRIVYSEIDGTAYPY